MSLLDAALWAGRVGAPFCFAACTLVASPDPLQEGCGAGAKPCTLPTGELGCVDAEDPAYGCAGKSCVACTLPAAIETCDAEGRCAVATCAPGRGNCNSSAVDGCETNLEDDYDNCNFCGHSCDEDLRDMAHTLAVRCRTMRCQIVECEPGFADCDGAAGNGCEASLAADACGLCDGCPPGSSCNDQSLTCE